MINKFKHQRTIGIIGVTPDSHNFIHEANKLGFKTYLLAEKEEEANLALNADQVFTGRLEQTAIHDEFLMACDLLVYFDESINSSEIERVQKTVVVPQGNELLSVVQDRVLQKAYLESLSMNIAPYATVVKPEDIEEGLRSIGYPAVMRPNQINSDSKNKAYFIYEESDIEKATSLLRHGTCVLESWLVSDRAFSISAAKTATGEIRLYPIVEREYRENRLSSTYVPQNMDEELLNEMERVAQVIFGELDFSGVASVEFIVTPANALYVGVVHAHPNIHTRYSNGACSMSTTEAHLRAVTGLPIPYEIDVSSSSLFVPFYDDQTEVINELLSVYPDWDFSFYPITKFSTASNKRAIGHIIIESTDYKKTLELLKEKGF